MNPLDFINNNKGDAEVVSQDTTFKKKGLNPKKNVLSIIDIIGAATYEKSVLDFDNPEVNKSYDQYMINRWLSMEEGLLYFAEKLSTLHNLTNEDHFNMLKAALPKEKIYLRYIKRKKDVTAKEKRYIADYFEIGLYDAESYIQQMTDSEISDILNKYKYGKGDMVKV